ncbi:hypothetical protein ARC20_06980 [Stenotrophomonas panacihumi]|uniref:Uncharacterized protein n=1 Tax=Stenotrophomonas panacihumi TaxID=676599 RepID=A0A0R0AV84_9GAMM|nr:hypothetical protein [Stenotrophomonas panacihumi]KRG45946.1 hypothetical protein ARC20_06980 [Stenotrophomonas panacihumi]PTN53994.1 hypothetical protein C9J98_12200 [Stenotrophomonas panacihumi]
MPPKTASARTSHWLWPLLLLLGCATALIAWLLVALSLGQQAGWMAILVALESAFMLRLGTFRPGTARAVIAVVATLGVILSAQWAIASAQMGFVMGLDVLASCLRMGPRLAWLLSSMANGWFDLACWAVGLVVAWVVAR